MDLRLAAVSGQDNPLLSCLPQILHPALASCTTRSQSIGWATERTKRKNERKKEKKNQPNPALLQFKCLTP